MNIYVKRGTGPARSVAAEKELARLRPPVGFGSKRRQEQEMQPGHGPPYLLILKGRDKPRPTKIWCTRAPMLLVFEKNSKIIFLHFTKI
jgi:hypothetical protein